MNTQNIVSTLLIAIALPTAAQNDSIAQLMRHIDEVTVTGTRVQTDVRHVPMTVNIIGRETLESTHKPSIVSSLNENVPGLFTTSRGVLGYGVSTGGTGGISIRGIGGQPTTGVLVLIDGHPQYQGTMGHSIADAYRGNGVERIEVLRGPASVLYGSNAMGGVINIVSHRSDDNCVETDANVGGGSYGTFMANIANRTRRNKFSSMASVDYERTDGHRDNMHFWQLGGRIQIAVEPTEHWHIQTDADLTQFYSSNPGTVDNPYIDNDQKILRGSASLNIDNKHTKTAGGLSAYVSWGRHKIDDGYHEGDEPKTYYFRSTDRLMGISAHQSMTFWTGGRLTLGADVQRIGGRSWNEAKADGTETVLADEYINSTAGYAELRQDILSYITLDLGMRLDHHSTAGTATIPQAGLTWHVNGHTDFRVLTSKGFRNPTIKELYMFKSRNENLDAESLMNYEVAFSQFLVHRRLKWGMNLFLIDADNMIQTIVVDGNPRNENTGNNTHKGLEAEATFRLTPHSTVGLNYSYLYTQNAVLAAPKHKLNVFGRMRQGNFEGGTNIQYVSGLRTNISQDNSHTEDFVLWNADVQYSFLPQAAAYLKAENILAKEYETVEGFPLPKATILVGLSVKLGR